MGTVSLALRNHPSIPERTRRRIQRIANELGYRPNALVSALMARIHTRRPSSESPVLGLILDEDRLDSYEQVPFYRELLAGVRDRAFQLGYRAENIPLKQGTAPARTLARALHARNIRGVILAPLADKRECRLSFTGLAACALGYTLQKPDLHRVVSNHSQGMGLAWSKLIERGYRRPGFIHSHAYLNAMRYERLGALTIQQTLHPEAAALPPLIFSQVTDENIDECMKQFVKWFRRHRPDVLVFPPWAMLKRLGQEIKIPEEAGVILSDVEPGWSQVRDGVREIGAGAVDMVVAQIHRNETGVPISPKIMAINSRWVDGFSLPARLGAEKKTARVRATPKP